MVHGLGLVIKIILSQAATWIVFRGTARLGVSILRCVGGVYVRNSGGTDHRLAIEERSSLLLSQEISHVKEFCRPDSTSVSITLPKFRMQATAKFGCWCHSYVRNRCAPECHTFENPAEAALS